MAFSNVTFQVLAGNSSALFVTNVSYTLTTSSFPDATTFVQNTLDSGRGIWVNNTFYPATAILSALIQ
jgi:hypothetical protein